MKKTEKKPMMTRNKRGISIEMAIGFMLVIFALCAVITTVTISMRARDRRVTEQSNDYFVLDQLGEYFVKAIQNMGSNPDFSDEVARQTAVDLNFIKEEDAFKSVDESQVEKFKVQIFFDDVTDNYKNAASTDSLLATRFTMRIWDKEDYEAAYQTNFAQTGSEEAADTYAMDSNDPVLIVSVDRVYEVTNTVGFAQYIITNWSDQENQQSKYIEAKNPVDKKNSNRKFHGLWLFLLLVVVVALVAVAIIL